MTISLRPVNKENYEQVCDLGVHSEQEDYVACNMWSLVEASYHPEYTPRAINHKEQAVGFIMWAPESERRVSIWRFMIDKKQQNKGFGRQALNLALADIASQKGVSEIEICYNPLNPVAKSFYQSFGFHETGMDDDGEDMLALINLKTLRSQKWQQAS